MWMQNQHKYSDASYQEKNPTNSANCLHGLDQLHNICNKPIEDLKRTLRQIPNVTEFRSDLVQLLATAANLLVVFDSTFDEPREPTEQHFSNADVHIESIDPEVRDPLTKFRTTSTSTTLLPTKLDKCSMTDKFEKSCITNNFHDNCSVPYEGRFQSSTFQKQYITEETQTGHVTITRLRSAFEKRLAEVNNTLKNLELSPDWKPMGAKNTPTSTLTRLSAGGDKENKTSIVTIEDDNEDTDDQLDTKAYKPTCTCRSHAKKIPKKSLRIPNPPNTPLETIFKPTGATVPIRGRDGRITELEDVVTPSVIRDKMHEFPPGTLLMARKERWLKTTSMLPEETEIDSADQHVRQGSTSSLVSKTTRTSRQFFDR